MCLQQGVQLVLRCLSIQRRLHAEHQEEIQRLRGLRDPNTHARLDRPVKVHHPAYAVIQAAGRGGRHGSRRKRVRDEFPPHREDALLRLIAEGDPAVREHARMGATWWPLAWLWGARWFRLSCNPGGTRRPEAPGKLVPGLAPMRFVGGSLGLCPELLSPGDLVGAQLPFMCMLVDIVGIDAHQEVSASVSPLHEAGLQPHRQQHQRHLRIQRADQGV